MPQHRVPARPDEIARFGDIAATVRAALMAKNMTVRQFNELCGRKPDATQLYQILNAKSAPSPQWRAQLHRHLGIPTAQLREKPLLQTEEAVQVAQAHARALPGPGPGRPPAGGDVLQFAVTATGHARVRLDVTLPVREAMPLIRLLLDQGFILSGEEE